MFAGATAVVGMGTDTTYAIVALLTAGTCLTVGLVTPEIVDNEIQKATAQLTVITGYDSDGFDAFANGNNSFNAYYMYDYQNPEGIVAGDRPNVTEIGPFVYSFKDYKFDVEFDQSQDKISYYSQRYYLFQPDKSCAGYADDGDYVCSEERDILNVDTQEITTVNYALQLVIYQSVGQVLTIEQGGVGFSFPVLDVLQLIIGGGRTGDVSCAFLQTLRNSTPDVEALCVEPPALSNTCGMAQLGVLGLPLLPGPNQWEEIVNCASLFSRVSVNQLLFGYTAPVLQAVSNTAKQLNESSDLTTEFPGVQNNFTSEQQAIEAGRITVGMGAVNANDVQYYQQWHGMSNLIVDAGIDLLTGGVTQASPWCQGRQEVCTNPAVDPNRIDGYAGLYFPPKIPSSGSRWKIWVPQTGRGFEIRNPPAEPDAPSSFTFRGVRLLRYGIAEQEFDNTSAYNRDAYYALGPRGLLNLTTMTYGAPISLSKPHFLDGDPALWQAIDGLAPPDRELHDVVIGLEPTTGANMFSRQRLQTNIELRPLNLCANVSGCTPNIWWPNLPQTPLPLFWAELRGELPADAASAFRNQVYFYQDLGEGVQWSFVGGASVAFAAFAFFGIRGRTGRLPVDMMGGGEGGTPYQEHGSISAGGGQVGVQLETSGTLNSPLINEAIPPEAGAGAVVSTDPVIVESL